MMFRSLSGPCLYFFQFSCKMLTCELIFSCLASAFVHISLAMSAAVLYPSLIPIQYKEK